MAKFRKVFHQVTIDEYLANQEELFPEGAPAPAPLPYTAPWRIKNAPIFPGAVDGIGAAPATPAPVVYSKHRRRLG